MPKIPPKHPAVLEGRTLFPKSVKHPQLFSLLKPASSNSKLSTGSNFIQKGKWKGSYLVSLTLEERKTCPSYCHHWVDCYGNNMYMSTRYKHGNGLEIGLDVELNRLCKKYNSVVVRLHILGDFYSVDYVNLWDELLDKYHNLKVFGYTARFEYNDPIYDALEEVRLKHKDRWWVRYSANRNNNDHQIFAVNENFIGDSFVCPQQTNKVADCISCGVCWQTNKSVMFLTH